LPPGSQELDGIVNLVDADAAAELDAHILDDAPKYITLRHGLNKSLNLLLTHYVESYDFVYFFSEHDLPAATNFGVSEAVTRPAAAGGVSEIEIAAEGYQTTGRVKSVIAFPYVAGIYPPLGHETLHYWAVDLDGRFGFGKGFDASSSYPSHWGFASVHGELGGFDGASLRCATPGGAKPPACTGLPSGRINYVMDLFAPYTNSGLGVPYAPLELYLMGLAPATEVPPTIQMLTGAKAPTDNGDNKTVTVEAAGMTTVSFGDIQARHGVIKPLAANQTHFSGAFVVLSATPAPSAVLKDVATFAAVFGGRKKISGWPSFSDLSGGRASMSTDLGPKRKVGDNVPKPRPPLTCDALAQNCPRSELGCYTRPPSLCALSGRVPLDGACNSGFACAPGLDCVSGSSAPTTYVCKPYCDMNGNGPASCATLCPDSYIYFKDDQGKVIDGLCVPK
jgi:hypothetical protein